MHAALCIAALAGVAYSAPQLVDLDAIAKDYPPPKLVPAPINVESNIPASSTAAPIVPLPTVASKKRDLGLEKRDGDCSPYPAGSGPVPSPDTPEAFQSDPDFASMANNAPTPDGYESVFTNKGASLSASNYMGLYTLTSYDTLTCASKCDQASGCSAFNVYIERDPSVNANAVNCPNPPSTTNYRCTLWGAPVCPEEATNSGQYQDSFYVVIAGSNAYNKDAPPPAISGYVGPQELGGAINAPTDSGSYMGYQFFPFSQSQGYDPQTCANACDAQTLYDSQHPAADGSYMSCVFFNAYVLSENAIPQGLYCSMYNETWGPEYGTNYGQYRGSDRYTVSESYSYTKSSYSGQLPPIGSVYTPNPLPTATSAKSSASSSAQSSSAVSSTLPSSSVTVVSSKASSSTSPSSSSAPKTTAVSTTASSRTLSATSSSALSTTAMTSSVCNPTPSNNVVVNGGFECGLAPWVAGDVINTTHSITSPGDNSNFAYEFDQTGPVNPSANKNPASVNQDLIVTVGQSYQLTYRTYFDKCDQGEGFVGLMLDHQPVKTTDACDLGAGAFKSNSYNFTATVNPFNLGFEFLTDENPVVMKIDNVVATPLATPLPSSTAPVVAPSCTNNVISNGDFETGTLSPWTVANVVGSSTYSLVSPGTLNNYGTSANVGSKYAFDASLSPSSSSQGNSSLTLQQTLNVCPGTNYNVDLDYKFGSTAAYDCSFSMQYPHGSVTGSSTINGAPAGLWTFSAGGFTAASNADVFKIVISCANGRVVHCQVDNVKITYTPYGV